MRLCLITIMILKTLSFVVTDSALPSPVTELQDLPALVVCDGPDEPTTLDPFLVFGEKSHTILRQIFDPLVELDDTGSVRPSLATTWIRRSPVELALTLNPHATFHDGTPLTTDDVLFSLRRYLDPKQDFPGRAWFDTIESIDADETNTIVVRTHDPDSLLELRLSLLLIVPATTYRTVGAADFGRAPTGTGPFRFSSWDAGRAIILHAVEEHWRFPLPAVGQLTFLFLDHAAQERAFIDRQVDLLLDVPGPLARRLVRIHDGVLTQADGFMTYTASLNSDSPFLASLDGRQALNLAIDRQDLVRYVSGGFGLPAASLSAPDLVGHDPTLIPYPTDPALARKLVDRVTEGRGVTLSLLAKENSRHFVTFLRHSWRAVGIETTVTYCGDAEFVRIISQDRHDYDICVGLSSNPIYHGSFVHSLVLASSSPFSLHRSNAFDLLLRECLAQFDPAEHDDRVRRLDRYVHENALSLFTLHRRRLAVGRSTFDFTPRPCGIHQFHDLRWTKGGDSER